MPDPRQRLQHLVADVSFVVTDLDRAIADALRHGHRTSGQIAEATGRPLSLVLEYLRDQAREGLVSLVIIGGQTRYELTDAGRRRLL